MPIARKFEIDPTGALRQSWTMDASARDGHPSWMDASEQDIGPEPVDPAGGFALDIDTPAGRYAMVFAILAMGCISIIQLHLA